MAEIRLLLDLYKDGLTNGLTEKRILRRFSLIISSNIAKVLAEKKNEQQTTFRQKY